MARRRMKKTGKKKKQPKKPAKPRRPSTVPGRSGFRNINRQLEELEKQGLI